MCVLYSHASYKPSHAKYCELKKISSYVLADVGSIKHWFSGEPLPNETALVQPRSVHEQEDGTILGICVTGKVWRY